MVTLKNSSLTTLGITTIRTSPREPGMFRRIHRDITNITILRNGSTDCAGALVNAEFVALVGGVLASSLEGPGIVCTILR
jgi:hypothetical protein